MTTYKVKFWGRKAGAIGICYWITTEVEAPEGSSMDQIRLRLYDRFDSVMLPEFVSQGEESQ